MNNYCVLSDGPHSTLKFRELGGVSECKLLHGFQWPEVVNECLSAPHLFRSITVEIYWLCMYFGNYVSAIVVSRLEIDLTIFSSLNFFGLLKRVLVLQLAPFTID